MAKITERRLPPSPPYASEVEELAGAGREAGQVAPGRPVLEVQLDLADCEPRPDGVDRDPDLHPVARGKRKHGAKHLGAHRALAGERRLSPVPAPAADRPARETKRDAEAAAQALGEGGDRQIALSSLHRVGKPSQLPCGRAEITVAEEERRRTADLAERFHRRRRRGHAPALPVRGQGGYSGAP